MEDISRTGDKKVAIEGMDAYHVIEPMVKRLKWGAGQENTFIGSLNAALCAMGEDVNYDYLMGISGAAFRLHWLWRRRQ